MAPKKIYDGVIYNQREGTLTVAKPGIVFKSSDDDANGQEQLIYRLKWGAIQNHTLNQSSSPNAVIKMTVAQRPGSVTFQLRNRSDLEALQAELSARIVSPSETTNQAPNANDSPKNSAKKNKASKAEQTPSKPEQALIQAVVGVEQPTNNSTVSSPSPKKDSKAAPAGMVPVIASDSHGNAHGNLYGTSKYMNPIQGARLVAEAEFEPFAPASCVCFGFCVNDKMRKRTYARVYENRFESNVPYSPLCCLGDERTMVDRTVIAWFDKMPNRTGMCCFIIPCACCGPPVVYTKDTKACCSLIDMRPCFGERILYSPCDCFKLRTCLCCGAQCYQCCSLPLSTLPVKNGQEFLAKWKGALIAYQDKHGIPQDQRVSFYAVKDRFCDHDRGTPIEAIAMER